MNGQGDRVINMLSQAELASATAAALAASSDTTATGLHFASDEQRHMAIASIFNSLSSFAAANQRQAVENQKSPMSQVSTLEHAGLLDQHYSSLSELANPLSLASPTKPVSSSTSMRPTTTKHLHDNLNPTTLLGAIQAQEPQPQPQHQQRINYCTICNKELCNKYFMKTHMLKMHGINLEMEQSTAPIGESEQSTQAPGSLTTNELSQISNEQSSAQSDGVQSETQKQKTTSVLNGFAGNSMGGVVCDICNKELCSKYFLKVHKQNTHGIVTDQLDAASQSLMYPLAAQLAAAAAAAAAGGSSGIFAPSLPTSASSMPPTIFPNLPHIMNANIPSPPIPGPTKRLKKPRLASKAHIGQPVQTSPFGESDAAIIGHMGIANPLTTFMCMSALGGPTGLTPALVVDNILRNQHLITGSINSKDRSNTQSTPSKGDGKSDMASSSAVSSGSSGARYFSHYTEACPMCDRRFKSIKWLKTHMMNDHKQEIAAYMHMMLQYIHYSSRASNQQVATAMAAAASASTVHNPIHFVHHQPTGAQIPASQPIHSHEQSNFFNTAPFSLETAFSANLLANQHQPFSCLFGSGSGGLNFNQSKSQPTTQNTTHNYFNPRNQQLANSNIGQHQQPERKTICALPADYVIHDRRKSPKFSVSLSDHRVESPASDISHPGSELNFESGNLGFGSSCGVENDFQLDLSRQPSSPATSEFDSAELVINGKTSHENNPQSREAVESNSLSGV